MTRQIDTNLLVRSVRPSDPQFAVTTQSIMTLLNRGERIQVVPQNLYEFWSVATRPIANNGLGMTPSQAQTEIVKIKKLFTLVLDPPALLAEWERIVVLHGVSGKEAHDARLVAAMNLNGITQILTFNGADFARYASAGIVAVNPASV